MTSNFRPTIAGTVQTDVTHKDYEKTNPSNLRFPLLASPKIDGFRMIVIDGVPYSRNLKPIRNKQIREFFTDENYSGFDGELISGDPTGDVFERSSSDLTTEDSISDFYFMVFDTHHGPERPFVERHNEVIARVQGMNRVKIVEHKAIHTLEELEAYEEEVLNMGYEGVMLRHPDGAYKLGRSTFKEHTLLKIKRFHQEEGEIVGFEERMENQNEATVNELGYTERSSHKDNMVGRGDLGSLMVRDLKTGVEFTVGTGFSDALRKEIWENKAQWLGKTITFKFLRYGPKGKPNLPVYKGERSEADMGGEE